MERAPSDIMAHSYVLDSNLWSMERATSDSESNASLRSSYYSDVSTDCTLLSDDDDDDDDMFLFDGPQPAQTIFDMDAYFATRPLSDHPASSDEDESDDGLDDDAAAALDRRPLQRAAHEFDASLAAGQIHLGSGDARSPSHTRSCSLYLGEHHAVRPRILSLEPTCGEDWSFILSSRFHGQEATS
eukprot:TRINITY_DN24100_c0_g2_i3.p1 TRINITY_DN24100_c0_g2~~TRINITY_DN24100_c0_g2_i3.p1  ORF type:complete len:186 (+),score=39.08 TRINITY_DN24100_c0_g2_i3:172-729(+)